VIVKAGRTVRACREPSGGGRCSGRAGIAGRRGIEVGVGLPDWAVLTGLPVCRRHLAGSAWDARQEHARHRCVLPSPTRAAGKHAQVRLVLPERAHAADRRACRSVAPTHVVRLVAVAAVRTCRVAVIIRIHLPRRANLAVVISVPRILVRTPRAARIVRCSSASTGREARELEVPTGGVRAVRSVRISARGSERFRGAELSTRRRGGAEGWRGSSLCNRRRSLLAGSPAASPGGGCSPSLSRLAKRSFHCCAAAETSELWAWAGLEAATSASATTTLARYRARDAIAAAAAAPAARPASPPADPCVSTRAITNVGASELSTPDSSRGRSLANSKLSPAQLSSVYPKGT
jgi:hypothetical protein